MAEKAGKSASLGTKPVQMKLFATWEVEKTSPNCVPRLCLLTLNRLVVLKPLENDLNSLIIAVKMQSSKRVLRSNEIILPANGLLDTELDLSFSLQYPHYLKRDGNKLQVMLQRRKKYKNKTILGYKILAIGQINMAQVLQRSVDKDLNLYSETKENSTLVARLTMLSLSSQPVDYGPIENGQRKAASSDVDRSPDVDNDSDDDYIEPEEWSNDEASDCDHVMLEEDGRTRPRKPSRGQIRPVPRGRQQRNIKQKFIALLKKFKVTDDVLDSEADHDAERDTQMVEGDDLHDLLKELKELEDLSDSGPELDAVSVVSTPKPRLRPFFTRNGFEINDSNKESGRVSDDNSSKKNDSDSLADRDTDPDLGPSETTFVESSNSSKSPVTKEKMSRMRSRSYRERKQKGEHKQLLRRNSTGVVEGSPRKVLLDQLSVVLGASDDSLPDSVVLVNTVEWQGQLMVQKLQEKQLKTICTCGDADVKAALNFLVTKIQKFCNSNSKSPSPVKVGIAGGDSYINSVLRPYVELFSAKPPDWQSYVRFLIIPFGSSCIGKYLGALDNMYSSLFLDGLWKDTFEKPEISKLDSQEIMNRVSKYVGSANGLLHIPVSEAMVMCRGKSSDEESSQMFVPFLSEVKIGNPETLNASMDYDDTSSMVSSPSLSSSPPSTMILLDKPKETQTPPSSPSVNLNPSTNQSTQSSSSSPSCQELMELQVEYWTVSNRSDSSEKTDKASKKDSNKSSLKSTFRSLHVQRPAQPGSESQSSTFSMVVVTREKKTKNYENRKESQRD